MSETSSPAVPLPAATILLLRNQVGTGRLQVFMVVRHHQIDFASGALVFPGGKVHQHDFDPGIRGRCDGSDGASDVELSLMVAAIREAFEESGVLLARDAQTNEFVTAKGMAHLDNFRSDLDCGDLPILQFLEENNLRLACDSLTRFSHWVTPEFMPKRFDTHFYLAIPPSHHDALHDGGETVDSVWINPLNALDEAKDGKRTIIFPTRMNLQQLGESKSAEAAVEAALSRRIVLVMPYIEQRDDGAYLCLPEDSGYGKVSISTKEM